MILYFNRTIYAAVSKYGGIKLCCMQLLPRKTRVNIFSFDLSVEQQCNFKKKRIKLFVPFVNFGKFSC